MKMQEGFLWGGATAANQCEGSASAGPSAFCPAGFGRIGCKTAKFGQNALECWTASCELW